MGARMHACGLRAAFDTKRCQCAPSRPEKSLRPRGHSSKKPETQQWQAQRAPDKASTLEGQCLEFGLTSLLLMSQGLARLDEHGALPLMLFHEGLWIITLPHASAQDLDASIVHFLPAMEATTLAHRTDATRAHVVHIVEEHLVPTVTPTQQQRHRAMENRPRAVRIGREELVPQMRVVEVGDEHPGRRESTARSS